MRSLGKTVEGRDIPVVEIATDSEPKPAIFLTAETHARELISTSVNVFDMLKLIQMGYVQKDPSYESMLK